MFGSTVIDVAIGLIFVYLLLSLICSAMSEIVERFARYRARDLERGLQELLHDPQWVHNIYNHALIWGLFEGEYSPRAKNLPSYIPATNFALAVMDLILPDQGASGATRPASGTPGVVVNLAGVSPAPAAEDALRPLREQVQRIQNPHVRQALMPLVSAAGPDVARARENIEGWFNNSMDRVSGWYKRRTQMIILVLAIVLSGLLNADTVAIVRVLSTDRTMRESLVAAAEAYAKTEPRTPSTGAVSPASATPVHSPSPAATPRFSRSGARAAGAAASPASVAAASPAPTTEASLEPTKPMAAQTPTTPGCEGPNNSPECRIQENLKEIKKLGLPMGWTREEGDPRSINITPQAWLVRLVGWLITAFAVSLGAPFWFDLLNKFIVVRSTVKPHEKSREEGSKG
jgi:hypothetical protein